MKKLEVFGAAKLKGQIRISGSMAQFDKVVFPLAKHEARIKFSVAPTETLGNFIFYSKF